MASKQQKSDHQIHLQYKDRMKRKVFLSLCVVALSFAFTLFPPEALKLLFGSASDLATAAGKLLGSLSIATLASGVLFATDSAFKGDNPTARWVRSIYPSNAAETKLKCTAREATAVWFKYFDTWGLPDSPHHALVANTYSATYQGRWMYYLRWTLGIFSALGIGAGLVNYFIFSAYSGEGAKARSVVHAFVFLLYFVGFLVIGKTNRIGDDGIRPTGCWERVEQVLTTSSVHFQRDVLLNADSLQDALGRVEALRRELEGKSGEPSQKPGPNKPAPSGDSDTAETTKATTAELA